MAESTQVHTVPWYSSGDGSDFPPRRSIIRRLKAAERRRAANSPVTTNASNAPNSRPATAHTPNSLNSVAADTPNSTPATPNTASAGVTSEPVTESVTGVVTSPVTEAVTAVTNGVNGGANGSIKSWAELARGKQKAQESPPQVLEEAPQEIEIVVEDGARHPLARVLYGFDPKLTAAVYANRTVAARGLINIGNICFMNSILQALMHCTPFYALLKKIGRESQFHIKSDTPILDGLIEFIDEFEREPPKPKSDQDESSMPSMSPDTFYSVIAHHPKFKHLKRGRQEDAEEFLGYLLEALQEEFERAMAAEPAMAKYEPAPELLESEDEWTQVGKGSKPVTARYSGKTGVTTPLNKIFSGQFKSVLERISPRSGAPSVTYDPFQHVQLDISDDSVHSIEDAFRMLSQPEQLTYQNNHTTIRAMKQVQFSALPGVLIVHLKRFTFDENGSQKITKPISFPYELEIPDQCLITAAQQRVYRLFAVVYHHGASAHAGHYTVDVRSGTHWTSVDDIETKKVELPWYASGRNDSSSEEERRTAYLLFYA